MLRVTIPAAEFYNEETEEFYYTQEQTLQLEHSLISLSKWESKWKKPFLQAEKTYAESIDYVRCMTITKNVDPMVYFAIPKDVMKQINAYIEDSMTATTFSSHAPEGKSRINNEIITAELIYYWMVAHQIPFECEKWHLGRLIALIQVCNIKNSPPKKMSRDEILRRNAELNLKRRKELNSKG